MVGKAIHSVPLACLFDQLYREMSEGPGTHRVSLVAEDELLMIISSLPMHWMDQRTQVSPHVYATDASLEGGGACVTTGLSARGRANHLLGSGDDLGGACDPILIIEVFGGMGGLRQACELLGLQPQGLIYIDTSDLGTKLVQRQCGYVLTFGDIRKINFEDVKGWRRSFPKVTRVILEAAGLGILLKAVPPLRKARLGQMGSWMRWSNCVTGSSRPAWPSSSHPGSSWRSTRTSS